MSLEADLGDFKRSCHSQLDSPTCYLCICQNKAQEWNHMRTIVSVYKKKKKSFVTSVSSKHKIVLGMWFHVSPRYGE